MNVEYLDEAAEELLRLPAREQGAISNIVEKLKLNGNLLGAPHTSKVKGAPDLRELRPRQGRSPWRPLYRRIGDTFWIAAIAPEAMIDRAGFGRAVTIAATRLDQYQESINADQS